MIGRKKEIAQLRELLHSSESEFVAVVGRRRVGKTFLIRQTYQKDLAFEVTGIQYASKVEQLSNFQFALRQYFPNKYKETKLLSNWIEAFEQLITLLSTQKRKVIFIDELPWIATHRSGFIKGLSFFWNSWASKNKIVLITCGSATSWMIKKIILNKGGLHNRVTHQIILLPFTLTETKDYLESRNIALTDYQIVQLYMILGGIPYYLKQVPKGHSIPQIVNKLLLVKNAPIKHEFENLYQALFNNYEQYIKIIKACFQKWKGLTHDEIAKVSKLPSGGSLSRMIQDLEVSGFLESTKMIGAKKKNTTVRLVDEFSIFYLQFIDTGRYNNWQSVLRSQAFTSWQGFAFENICIKHIQPIKKALEVGGVNSHTYSLYQKGDEQTQGTQIDMIIQRDDQILNLCEIKFYNKEVTIDKKMHHNILQKSQALQSRIRQTSQIHITMITTYGVKQNKYSNIVQRQVTMTDLFL